MGGVVVRSWTNDSEVAGSIPTRTAEQVIYTRGAQANSFFHPSKDLTPPASAWKRPRGVHDTRGYVKFARTLPCRPCTDALTPTQDRGLWRAVATASGLGAQ